MIDFDELERSRITYKNRTLISIAVAIGIVLVSVFIMSYFRFEMPLMVIFIIDIVIITIASAIIVSGPKKSYVNNFKDYFVKRTLEKIFTDLQYDPDKGIPESVIAGTGMMYTGDRYTTNDFISGKYKNINFMQSDVHIEEEHQSTDSDGNTTTYYVTIFRGRWMIFDFNKTFKANVEVCENGFSGNRANTLFGKSKYNVVKMESEEFNKKFRVYAQDPHDAFYIITPSLMEKIKRLEAINKGKLFLGFCNNQLHVGIDDGTDSFEPGSCFSEINEEEVVNRMSTDVSKITMFVDELELDNDLFRKGV